MKYKNIKNQREIFNNIYKNKMKEYLINGYTEDKSSRKAHMYAVKYTWIFYNKQFNILK